MAVSPVANVVGQALAQSRFVNPVDETLVRSCFEWLHEFVLLSPPLVFLQVCAICLLVPHPTNALQHKTCDHIGRFRSLFGTPPFPEVLITLRLYCVPISLRLVHERLVEAQGRVPQMSHGTSQPKHLPTIDFDLSPDSTSRSAPRLVPSSPPPTNARACRTTIDFCFD
jgi:hypothetical protein